MSKEAKIGLLLSLVLIVAIAIILKGVHYDSMNDLNEMQALAQNNRSIHPEQLPLNAVQFQGQESYQGQETDPGEGGILPGESYQTSLSSRPRQDLNPQHIKPAGPIVYNTPRTTESVTDNEIRYRQALPGLSNLKPVTETNSIQPISGVYRHAVDAVIDIADSSSIKPGQNNRIDSIMNHVKTTQGSPFISSSSQPIASSVNQTYRVEKGDDLSRIALKVYGKTAGKRWVNVKRIFEANRKGMDDINHLKIGQTLVIPQLPGKAVAAMKPVSTQVGNRGSDRVYTVQKGDSLWTIAEKQLGSGKRFGEIAKLNDRLLSDENSIRPGMKIKLPTK